MRESREGGMESRVPGTAFGCAEAEAGAEIVAECRGGGGCSRDTPFRIEKE